MALRPSAQDFGGMVRQPARGRQSELQPRGRARRTALCAWWSTVVGGDLAFRSRVFFGKLRCDPSLYREEQYAAVVAAAHEQIACGGIRMTRRGLFKLAS